MKRFLKNFPLLLVIIFIIGALATFIYLEPFPVEAAAAPDGSTDEEQKEVLLGLPEQIGKFYSFALGIGGLVALGVLVFGGILYTTSAGNASRQDDAKQWIIGALVGLLILFGSWFILNTINPELTKLKDIRLLVNKAAEDTSESSGSFDDNPSPYPVIDGQTCPMAPGFTYGQGCGADRPGITGGHQGVDLMAKLGSPLYAIEDGVIAGNWGWNDLGGWRFWLYADSGNKYYYAHTLSKEALPPLGKRFKAGDLIGYVGESGNGPEGTYGQVGGPHLHLQWIPAQGGPICGAAPYVDPVPLIKKICSSDLASSNETGGSNSALTQVLNKPSYSGFGVVFTEIGGQSASVGADKTFPIASLYKLFVAKYLYELQGQGRLNFSQKIPLVDVSDQLAENRADGVDFLYRGNPPREGQLVSINECMPKMIIYSDNVCGKALLEFARSKGYKGPSGSSQQSATDIADLLRNINQNKSLQPLYNLMLQQYHDDKIPAGTPSGAQVANKTGELHDSNYSHDAAIIKYEGRTYILVILTHLDPDVPSTNKTIAQLTSELFNALKK